MPLIHGKSEKSFKKNLETEMEAGKPMKQSLAIAYSVKRKAQKKGMGGEVDQKASGYEPMPKEHVVHNPKAIYEDDRALNQHGADEEGPQHTRMAEGGDVDVDVDVEDHPPYYNAKRAKEFVKGFNGEEDSMYAEGGFIGSHQGPEHENDMVGRIIKKRQHMYSQGGQVANDDHAFEYEYKEPNQFDDLVRRDKLAFSYDGANSGDYDGSDLNQEKDIVHKIMKKRKQHNPNPA